jgi:hypothetical protein
VIYGKDTDLPAVPGGTLGSPEIKGLGQWFHGGYTFNKPESSDSLGGQI